MELFNRFTKSCETQNEMLKLFVRFEINFQETEPLLARVKNLYN